LLARVPGRDVGGRWAANIAELFTSGLVNLEQSRSFFCPTLRASTEFEVFDIEQPSATASVDGLALTSPMADATAAGGVLLLLPDL
jgi:hypothetical protein